MDSQARRVVKDIPTPSRLKLEMDIGPPDPQKLHQQDALYLLYPLDDGTMNTTYHIWRN